MGLKNSVSSKDVAKEAGVSQATVSYVLNNAKGVSITSKTREAVLEAARRLNYYPNYIARGMKLKRSMSIGVVTERNVTNFYFMKTLEGIKDGIQKHNYSLNLLFSKPGELSNVEFINYYYSNRLDGIIFAFDSVDEEMLSHMNAKEIPFVMVNINPADSSVYEVCTDLLDHMRDVVKHLHSKGVRSIGYVGPEQKKSTAERIARLKEAAEEHGMEFKKEHVVLSIRDDTEITAALASFLQQAERPQAVIAGAPRYGLLAARCALLHGIKVPGQLRIISLGSSNLYTLVYPSISAVEVPLYDMGLRSAEKLFEIMSGNKPERTTVLPSELVIRESS